MTLDLREIIGIPGTRLAFDYAPDLGKFTGGAFLSVTGTPRAYGHVRNDAGALSLTAHVDAELNAVCARCMKEFMYVIGRDVYAALTESESAIDDPELYYIAGAGVDLDGIIVTELLLDSELNPLCADDCRGLCEMCGADLNEGGCECSYDADPRLAALAQLLGEPEDET